MFTKPILFSLAVFSTVNLFPQSYTNASAESVGRGGTGAAKANFSSVYLNAAGIANQHDFCFTANYNLPYILPELSVRQFSALIPFKKGLVYSTIGQYGAELYQENKVAIGFSKALSDHFRASFTLHYFQICQSGYKDGQIYASCGIQYDVCNSLSFGVVIINPEQSSIDMTNDSTEPINSIYHFGSLWKVSDSVNLLYDLEKVTNLRLIHQFGFDYLLHDRLSFRCGIMGKPIQYCIGSGLKIKKLSLDFGMMVHQTLGMSSSVSLTYTISKKS